MGTIMEVTKYIASDGKMFDTREECQAYEDMGDSIINELKNCVRFITDSMTIISKWKKAVNKDSFEANLQLASNECAFVEIIYDLSEAAINYLDKEVGIIIPSKRGRYRYDYDHCVWLSLKHDIEELESNWNMSVAEIAGMYE